MPPLGPRDYPLARWRGTPTVGAHSLLGRDGLRFRRAKYAAILGLALMMPILFFGYGLAKPGHAARAPASSFAATAFPGGSPFVIADFDGDREPDLATVRAVRGDARSARYSIQFQLTSGNWQTVGVTAPLGGLQIVARDVNGDSALDVVIRTAWRHQAVAVLLNDGQGNFKSASPASFSVATSEALAQFLGKITVGQAQDKSVLRWSPSGGAEASHRFSRTQLRSGLLLRADYSLPAASPHATPFGRAPPFSHV